jgi:hypothetical protein
MSDNTPKQSRSRPAFQAVGESQPSIRLGSAVPEK